MIELSCRNCSEIIEVGYPIFPGMDVVIQCPSCLSEDDYHVPEQNTLSPDEMYDDGQV